MSAHTPGPWVVAPALSDSAGRFDINCASDSPAGPYFIAETCAGMEEAEERANAALIAAAPDLLDAARAAFALLTDPDAEPMDADRVTDILRAAISRATT